jgi:hypothetical protein
MNDWNYRNCFKSNQKGEILRENTVRQLIQLLMPPHFLVPPFGPENCLETNWCGTGPWNDVNCEKRIRKFVCEFPVGKY